MKNKELQLIEIDRMIKKILRKLKTNEFLELIYKIRELS